jgi:hypothetical protein
MPASFGHGLRGRAAVGIGCDFLPVQRDHDAGRDAAGGADDGQRFADGGAGGDHVVDDQHAAPGQRRADQVPPSPWSLASLRLKAIGRRPRGPVAGKGGGQRMPL